MAAPPDFQANRHRAEEMAVGLPPLLVAAERVASTVAQGVHGRRRIGQGETFWQFRRYEPTDSAQAIDWRQSAKTRHLFVRETEWEAAQSIWLWRDDSPSMRYRSKPDLPEKHLRAELLLLALASLLVRGGEHIALLGDGSVPSSGRTRLERIAHALLDRDEAARESESLPTFEPLPRHSHLVMIGDLLSPLEEIDATVRGFAGRGVNGHLLQILDPSEESLPFRGRARFEGMEGEGDVLVRRVESARGEYRSRLAAHVAGLEAICRRAGWTFTRHHTENPPESALLALFMVLSGALWR